MEITEQYFYLATGRKPDQDDMERVNCKDAGKVGHDSCGWNYTRNRPAYEYMTFQIDRVPVIYK